MRVHYSKIANFIAYASFGGMSFWVSDAKI